MTWRHTVTTFAGRLRSRVEARTHRCRSWAPMYEFDGIGMEHLREWGERCTRLTNHDGAHSNGETTWT